MVDVRQLRIDDWRIDMLQDISINRLKRAPRRIWRLTDSVIDGFRITRGGQVPKCLSLFGSL